MTAWGAPRAVLAHRRRSGARFGRLLRRFRAMHPRKVMCHRQVSIVTAENWRINRCNIGAARLVRLCGWQAYEPVMKAWIGDARLIEEDSFHVIARSASGEIYLCGEHGRKLHIIATDAKRYLCEKIRPRQYEYPGVLRFARSERMRLCRCEWKLSFRSGTKQVRPAESRRSVRFCWFGDAGSFAKGPSCGAFGFSRPTRAVGSNFLGRHSAPPF